MEQPARHRLDRLLGELNDALEPTGPYPVIHLANASHPDDDELDFSSDRALRRRLRQLERAAVRMQLWLFVTNLLLLTTWIVLWQNW